MRFFDSPKNRAMWERKLSGLRQEKQRRRENGFAPVESGKEAAMAADNPFRKKIGFEELERRELENMGAKRVRRPGRELRAAKEMEREKHTEKSGMSL